MSIQSEITRINSAVTSQTTLINQIKTALEGKASGGGGEGDFSADKYFESGYAEINLPNAEAIRPYAFYNNTTLTNITMPKVKSIGDCAFQNCSYLALTSLPNNLETIGSRSFSGCKNTFTSFPSGLKSIDARAFFYNNSLTSITFKGTPTSIASNAFDGCDYLTTINVPWAEGAVANAPWGATYATINYNYTGG